MAENSGANTAMTSEDNMEHELTMCDVLEEEKELEEDAKAVLGDCDDTNCTYNVGYVCRQALYACATCTTSGVEPGGVCLACSYACHEGHDLIELYTKRNFRCDCGNKRFPGNPCRLCPDKDDFNSNNSYNQNFSGVYCDCGRPYPDLNDETLDEMIQCVMCEDWYHGRHLGAKVPDHEDYEEMICAKCMDSHSFLHSYKTQIEADKIISVDDHDDKTKISPVKIEKGNDNVNTPCGDNVNIPCGTSSSVAPIGDNINSIIKSESETANGATKVEATESKKRCLLKGIKTEKGGKSGPGFFPEGWRAELCACDDCKMMYEKENCLFLIDESDTIKAYEERGKCRNGEESQYDKGMSALGKMDRVKQMEAIRGYKNMKDKLKEYLKTFAEEGRAVSAQNIRDFFDGMQQTKRRRLEVPFFCR